MGVMAVLRRFPMLFAASFFAKDVVTTPRRIGLLIVAAISGWFAGGVCGREEPEVLLFIVIGGFVVYPLAVAGFLTSRRAQTLNTQTEEEARRLKNGQTKSVRFYKWAGWAGVIAGLFALLHVMLTHGEREFAVPVFLLSSGCGSLCGVRLAYWIEIRRGGC